MIDKFCEKFIYLVREKEILYTKNLRDRSSIRSFEDYQFLAGKLKGYEECEEILKKLFGEFFEVTMLETIRPREKTFEEEFMGQE